MSPPIVWSIAGNDSGGGAGLSADQRAAEAFGVHLCPVVAVVTAQHSRAVTRCDAVPEAWLDAQLQALADDLPPRVVKTGLLGSAEQVRLVARWVCRLREAAPVALVVDPVMVASTGARLVDDATRAATRELLLPLASVVTPNRAEALALLGLSGDGPGPDAAPDALAVPALARRLRALGAGAVCITGGDSADVDAQVLDWLDTPHAAGWLALPRLATRHHHGSGCTFASSVAAAMALGFVDADAAVLAKMATAHALALGHAAGGGAGPVKAAPGFALSSAPLPCLSWDELPVFAAPRAHATRPLGLYALVDSTERAQQVLAAGVGTLQWRVKAPADASAAWHAALQDGLQRALQASRAAGATLVVNDHWRLAMALGADAVHLGQEDLLAAGHAGRAALAASGVALGVSAHSLWELCRARSLGPRYIACGPVWPTLTKRMPWRAQGLHNLRWWRHAAGAPVVAIGGILSADQVQQAAACGVDGVCVVRGLGPQPQQTVPALRQAFEAGRARWETDRALPSARHPTPALPHPVLVHAAPWDHPDPPDPPGPPGPPGP